MSNAVLPQAMTLRRLGRNALSRAVLSPIFPVS
jgi:hypothetical protein